MRRPRLTVLQYTILVWAWALLMLALAIVTWPAHAQNPDPVPHMRYHEYYRQWKQPGSAASCCDARQYGEGADGKQWPIYGDCEPTRAHIGIGSDGQPHWYARLPYFFILQGFGNGGDIEIPDAKVLHERNPSYEEAHLCWTPQAGVMCFVPPDTGG